MNISEKIEEYMYTILMLERSSYQDQKFRSYLQDTEMVGSIKKKQLKYETLAKSTNKWQIQKKVCRTDDGQRIKIYSWF